MLLKPKYGRFRNDSVTSSDDLMQSLAMSGKVVASSSTPGLELPPLETAALPSAQVLADSPGLDGEQDGTTTFCMLIPKMPQWKFSNSLLSRSPSNSSSSSNSSKDSGRAPPTDSSPARGATAASGPVAGLAAVFNSCDPVCVGPCSLQAARRQRASPRESSAGAAEGSPGGSGSFRTGMNRRTRVEGMWLGDNFTQKGSFINKPSQGWLHPDKKISSTGASYIVRVSPLAYHLEISPCFPPSVVLQVCSGVNRQLCSIIDSHSFTFTAPTYAALKKPRTIWLLLRLINNCNILSSQKLSSGKTAYDMRTMVLYSVYWLCQGAVASGERRNI